MATPSPKPRPKTESHRRRLGVTVRALLGSLALLATLIGVTMHIQEEPNRGNPGPRTGPSESRHVGGARTDESWSPASANSEGPVAIDGIQGLVFEFETGEPIAGATVRATAVGREALQTGPTDRSGLFTIETREPGRYNLTIRSDRHVNRTLPDVASGAPLLRIALTRGLTVSGRVYDLESGNPVRTGRVGSMDAYRMPSAPLDDEGRFEISGLTGPIRSFRVWSEGWSSSSLEADPAPLLDPNGRQIRDAVVRVPRAAALRGVVRGVRGETVSGAWVVFSIHGVSRKVERLDREDTNASTTVAATTSDATGRFVLPPPNSRSGARSGHLFVRHSDYAPKWMTGPFDPEIVVSLDRGTDLVIDVETEDGSRAPQARVELLRADGPRPSRVLPGAAGSQTCDDDGRVRFARVSEGAWLIRAEAADGRATGESVVEVAQDDATGITVRLAPVDRVVGRVVDENGDGVPDIPILVGPEPQSFLRSDSRGRFAERLVATSQNALTVWDSAAGMQAIPIQRNTEMRIVLGPHALARRVHLRVIDAGTEEAVANGQVRVWSTVGATSRNRDTAFSCGEAYLRVPVDGSGRIRCTAPGRRAYTAEVRDLVWTNEVATVRMEPARTHESQAVQRVILRVTNGRHPVWIGLYEADSGRRWPSPRHLGDGRYAFSWLTAKSGVFVASGPDGYTEPESFTVAANRAETELTVQLASDGGIVGGAAHPNSTVFLRDSGGRTRRLRVREDGTFRSGQLAPGEYWIRPSGGTWQRVEIASRADVDAELR